MEVKARGVKHRRPYVSTRKAYKIKQWLLCGLALIDNDEGDSTVINLNGPCMHLNGGRWRFIDES